VGQIIKPNQPKWAGHAARPPSPTFHPSFSCARRACSDCVFLSETRSTITFQSHLCTLSIDFAKWPPTVVFVGNRPFQASVSVSSSTPAPFPVGDRHPRLSPSLFGPSSPALAANAYRPLATAGIATIPPSGTNPFVAGHGSQPVSVGVPVPVPGVPGCTVTPMPMSNSASTPYTFTFTANVTPSTYNHADAPKQEPTTPSTGTADDPAQSLDASKTAKRRNLSDSDGENPLGQFYSPSIPMQQKQDSHSRRVPDGHIPRPPNAFILFRSDLVQRKAVPSSLEAGKLWL
jgi:hypothetical protein